MIGIILCNSALMILKQNKSVYSVLWLIKGYIYKGKKDWFTGARICEELHWQKQKSNMTNKKYLTIHFVKMPLRLKITVTRKSLKAKKPYSGNFDHTPWTMPANVAVALNLIWNMLGLNVKAKFFSWLKTCWKLSGPKMP